MEPLPAGTLREWPPWEKLTVISLEDNPEVSNLYPVMNRIVRTVLAGMVVCGAVACATGPHKTPAQLQADSQTADSVQGAFKADTTLYSRHITVRADAGVVTLGGYVWTPAELEEAVSAAESVEGVTKVVDRMEVDRGAVSDSAVSR